MIRSPSSKWLDLVIALLASGSALFFLGCATIMHGTTQEVGLSSVPTGASISVDNHPLGNTPAFVNLTRKDHHIIRIELDGYQPFEATLTRKVSGWVWGNIIFGGLPGLAIDAITGGLYKLTPEQIHATLARGRQELKVTEDSIYLLVTLDPDESWQKIGSIPPIDAN